MTNERFDALFGGPPREPDEPLDQRHMDLAASIQAGDGRGRAAPDAQPGTRRPSRRISASPAAWRSIASPTARCCASGNFDNIWVQPAAGDAGGALGAALAAYHQFARQAAHGASAARRHGRAAISGPSFTQDRIEKRLTQAGAVFTHARPTRR